MISESYYWKRDLVNWAKLLKKYKSKRGKLSNKRYVEIEKMLLIGFYTIRKLIESRTKITHRSQNLMADVLKYLNIRKVNFMNKYDIEKNYSMDNAYADKINIKDLSNLFVHSYFMLIANKSHHGKLDGVFVTSDYIKNKYIYFIDVDTIINLYMIIGNDYPHKACYVSDGVDGYNIVKLE